MRYRWDWRKRYDQPTLGWEFGIFNCIAFLPNRCIYLWELQVYCWKRVLEFSIEFRRKDDELEKYPIGPDPVTGRKS